MSEIYARPATSPRHERLVAEEQFRAEDLSSRALNNYGSFPASSSKQKLQGTRRPTPPSAATMSDPRRSSPYDVPLVDVYQRGPEQTKRPPREQLPPLSSIFPSSRPSTSMQTSYSDRSPTFPAVNLQHSRQPTTPNHQDHQSWDAAYSRRPTSHSISSQYSCDGRPGQSRSSELPPPPLRPADSPHNSNTPRYYDSRYSPVQGPRMQVPPSRSGWSPRSEPAPQEYFPGTSRDTSSSFRPQSDQHHSISLQPQTKEPNSRSVYGEPPDTASAGHGYAGPPSASATEPATTKDGLGPKIWTGTQFLPRFVRQAEVPGEGLCYFYDDGTHCKTHIDGEAVNAHWGVTKAGKPRKRLAIACITCREKKIKCDPDYPRCTQCEKFGRVCKFKNAPRGGQGSPEASPGNGNDHSTTLMSQVNTGEPPKLEVRDPSHGISVISSRRPLSPEPEFNPAKRMKHGNSPPLRDTNDQHLPEKGPSPRQRPASPARMPSRDITAQLTTNPILTERELVMELMRLYFIHMGTTGAYAMVPEKIFMHWLTDAWIQKSPDDLMLIYTMLAMATVFSPNPEHKERGTLFAAVGRFACDQRHYSLQLIQSRLILSLYYYAIDNQTDCWDFAGSALRAATGMRLNCEAENIEDIDVDELPFKLSRAGFAECRRRTFWACFIFDRFSGFCQGVPSALNPRDIFLRLPCDEKLFEGQIEVKNPYFDPSRTQYGLDTIGSLAYLISIASLWDDVMANVYRSSRRHEGIEEDSVKVLASYANFTARLEGWRSALPDDLSYSLENLDKAAVEGTLSTFITIHSLYNTSQMNLNRHVRPSSIPPEQLEHNIRTATSHAESVLQMASALAARTIPSNNKSDAKGSIVPFSSPFIANAIICAIDILSAKGYLSSLPLFPSKIRGAMAIVTELGTFWHPCKQLKDMLVARNADLVAGPAGWTGFFGPRNIAIISDGKHGDEGKEGDGGGPRLQTRKPTVGKSTYEMQTPIIPGPARDDDCLYAVGIEVWQKALGKTTV